MKTKTSSFLTTAKEKFKKEKFEYFVLWAREMRENLPPWLMDSLALIPINSLMRDFEKQEGRKCFWEDFLYTLFMKDPEYTLYFQTNTRMQVTPFGKHYKVGLNDEIPEPEGFESTSGLFFEIVGKHIFFTQEEGYLIISFKDPNQDENEEGEDE